MAYIRKGSKLYPPITRISAKISEIPAEEMKNANGMKESRSR